jgi:hypothetical protein
MTLLEAFRACGPLVGDPKVDELRRRAMGVLYDRLAAMAGRDPRLEDAPAVVTLRLQQSGPRSDARYDTDESVERYLRRAIRNFGIDCDRAGRGKDSFDELAPARPPGPAQREPADLRRAAREHQRAFECLFGTILPACRPGTVAAMSIRRRVAEGRASFDDCVREASGEVTKQGRDAFYQRQHRAFADLAKAVAAHIAERGLPAWEAGALRVVLGELKDAEAGWPLGEGA